MRLIMIAGIAATMLASSAFADPATTTPAPATTGTAAATTPAPTTTAPAAAAVADSDPVQCGPMYHEGALLGGTECHKASVWRKMRERQEHDVSDFQRKALTSNYTGRQ